MRILIVSQYFWPESFRINDLVAGLVERGHVVTILTGKPNYPDGQTYADFKANSDQFNSYKGCDVLRVPMVARGHRSITLLLNYASFAISASIWGPYKLRGRAFHAIFVFEPSPIFVGLPGIVLRALKRAPLTFWVLDLWPETLKATGVVRSQFGLRAVGWVVKFIYDRCDCILAQSRSFIPEIERYGQSRAKIEYFPSWADEVLDDGPVEPAAEVTLEPDKFNVVFTGNMGEAQDFPAVLDAAELLRNDRRLRWIIVGDGRLAAWVRREVSERGLSGCVLLPGRFPLERMRSFYRHADALLVCLRPEPIFSLTIPGKLQSYLAEGLPILAMLDGEGADLVRQSAAGLVSPAGNGRELAARITEMMAMPDDERKALGRNGRRLSETDFNRERSIDRLIEIMSSGLPP